MSGVGDIYYSKEVREEVSRGGALVDGARGNPPGWIRPEPPVGNLLGSVASRAGIPNCGQGTEGPLLQTQFWRTIDVTLSQLLCPVRGRTLSHRRWPRDGLVFHQNLDLPCSPRSRCSTTRWVTPGWTSTTATTWNWLGTAAWASWPRPRPGGANRDWGAKLGYSPEALAAVNRKSVVQLERLRDGFDGIPVVLSGNIGPRGDGYDPETLMSPDEAETYHRDQIRVFSETAADLVTALTMTHEGEAVGLARAAGEAGIARGDLVHGGDRWAVCRPARPWAMRSRRWSMPTGDAPAYYMINCAHPTHFQDAMLGWGAAWTRGIKADVRANASRHEPRGARRGRPSWTTATRMELGGQHGDAARALMPNLTRDGRVLRHRHAPRGRDRGCPDRLGVVRGQQRRAPGEQAATLSGSPATGLPANGPSFPKIATPARRARSLRIEGTGRALSLSAHTGGGLRHGNP